MNSVLKLVAFILLFSPSPQAQEQLSIDEVRELLSDETIFCFDPFGRECASVQMFEFMTPTRGFITRVILDEYEAGTYLRSQTFLGFRVVEDELCYSAGFAEMGRNADYSIHSSTLLDAEPLDIEVPESKINLIVAGLAAFDSMMGDDLVCVRYFRNADDTVYSETWLAGDLLTSSKASQFDRAESPLLSLRPN